MALSLGIALAVEEHLNTNCIYQLKNSSKQSLYRLPNSVNVASAVLVSAVVPSLHSHDAGLWCRAKALAPAPRRNHTPASGRACMAVTETPCHHYMYMLLVAGEILLLRIDDSSSQSSALLLLLDRMNTSTSLLIVVFFFIQLLCGNAARPEKTVRISNACSNCVR